MTNIKKQLYALFLMQSIDSLAGGMISIFIPIYFLSLGYSLPQVFIYYIIRSLGILGFFYVAGLFAQRFGLRKTILLHLPFLFGGLFLINILSSTPIPLWLIALVNAIDIALYWFSLHVLFAKKANNGELANEVGKLFGLPQLLSVGAPLLGGLITFYFGFKTLFITALATYLLSAVPLLFMGEFEIKIDLDLKKIRNLFRKYPRYFRLETFANVFGDAEGILWPIFVYLTLKNVLSLGAVGTFLGIGAALFTLLVGKLTNGNNKIRLLRIGALSLIMVWALRMTALNQLNIYILTILAGFLGVLISIPFTSIIYDIAQKDDTADFIIFREIPVTLGRLILYALAILMATNIKWSFLIVILALIPFLFFKYDAKTN